MKTVNIIFSSYGECSSLPISKNNLSSTFLFSIKAAPILDKSPATLAVLVIDGLEMVVSCSLDKGNPLPTFTWEYQNSDCPDDDSCLPDENKWKSVPVNLMNTPTNKPTNQSVVRVERDQLAAFYRCKAVNAMGNDTHVVKLVRIGKEWSIVFTDKISVLHTCVYMLWFKFFII